MEPTPAQRIRADAKEATRLALLRAGLEATIANGGTVPSIETVCARAGFTRGAFYVHFKSRDEFMVEVLDWVVRDIFEAIFAGAGARDADVRTIIDRFAGSLAASSWPDVAEIRSAYLGIVDALRLSERARERHAELMTGAIARLTYALRAAQDEGAVRADVDPAAMSKLLMLLSVGAIMWDGVGIDIDARALAGSLLTLLEPPTGNE